MFLPLPTPKEMTIWDQSASHIGVPESILMENASREAFHILLKTFGPIKDKYILVMMGSGNNGGDAVCLARHLHDAGGNVLVLHTRPFINYRGTSGQFLRLAKHCGVSFMLATSWLTKHNKSTWSTPDVIIDGLIGIGLTDNLKELEIELINHINLLSKKSFILSLDIPSGLSGLTGKTYPTAVIADVTVTFEAAKPGLVLPEAMPYIGSLHICSIGIPLLARKKNQPSYQMIASRTPLPLPIPGPLSYKNSTGHILIIGGSAGSDGILTGAPYLSALAALRTGAGLVTIAAPHDLCFEIKGGCPDIMALPLGSSGTTAWSKELVQPLLSKIAKFTTIILGPGMGREDHVASFIKEFLSVSTSIPMVIDADALYILAQNPCLLQQLKPIDVLTPHPGEASLLLNTTTQDIKKDRLNTSKNLSSLAPTTWILKGAGTLISAPGNPTAIAPHAIPNLAVAGSGDVLSGCIAALLTQKIHTYIAACLAVQIHIEAGILLLEQYPFRGNLASDIIQNIPKAYTKLIEKGKTPTYF